MNREATEGVRRGSPSSVPRKSPIVPKTAKGHRSREALRLAARKVFQERGYSKARVQDMAEAANFSLGAFYRYFHDKHDVLMSLLEEFFENMYELSRSPWDPGDPERSVLASTIKYFEMYEENADLYRVLVETAPTEPAVNELWSSVRQDFYDRIERSLRRGQTQGVVRADLDPALAAALLGGMTEHYAYLIFVADQGVPRSTIESAAKQISMLWSKGAFTESN